MTSFSRKDGEAKERLGRDRWVGDRRLAGLHTFRRLAERSDEPLRQATARRQRAR